MKKTIAILLLLATLNSNSQDIESWRRQVEDQVLNQSQKENNLKTKNRADIIAVPICYYACPGSEIWDNKKSCIIIDSFASYALIMNKDNVKGIAQNTGKKKFGFYTTTELERLKRKEAEDTTWQMIRLARSRSSNYFFVYFFPPERNRYEIIGFIEKGRTLYIDRKLKIYKNIQQLITDRYKDKEKFITRIDDQHIKKLLQKKMTKDDARKIIDNDYIQHTQYNPQDTAGIMKRFLDEFTAYVQVTSTEKGELKSSIINGLEKSPFFKDKRYPLRIPFFEKNIFPTVCAFGTPEELKNYLEYRGMRNWLIKKAFEKLSSEPTWQ
jgi:hypothetical protein